MPVRPRKLAVVLLSAITLAGPSVADATGAAGDLDLSFHADGRLWTNFGAGYDFTEAVALQGDGKIVAVGDSYGNDRIGFAIARYQSDGTLDPSFGGDGRVTTEITSENSFAKDVAIQADGKIVVVGPAGEASEFAVVRYNSDGTLDPSFGGDGMVQTVFAPFDYEVAEAVVIQGDGRIVVAGTAAQGRRFALARYNPDGTLDPTFGGDGKLTTNLFRGDAEESVTALALQRDGKIVAAGWGGADIRFSVARYNADGTLDPTFSRDGKLTTNLTQGNDYLSGVAIQADGKIIVAGRADWRGGSFALLRYKQSGTLDASFGSGGKVMTDFTRGSDAAAEVEIQANGRIVAGGWTRAGHRDGRFALARYRLNGRLDRSFSGNGKLTTDFTTGGEFAHGMALQGDGKIIAVGGARGGKVFAVARYLGE